MSLIALKSCTSLYFPVLAFFTVNIGVLHVVFVVFIRIPAFSMSAMTGRIPSLASADSGYCGFIGLRSEVTFTFIGSTCFINPTSVDPLDHKDFGKASISVSCTVVNISHFSSVTRHEVGEVVK